MDVNFVDLFTEFVGSFVFVSVILLTGNAFFAGLCLVSMVKFAEKFSGGHFNPIVSLALSMRKNVNARLEHVMVYSLAQVAGAIASVTFVNSTEKTQKISEYQIPSIR